MIVYADRKASVRTKVTVDNWRDTLIRFGAVESAVADALSSEQDAPHPVLEQLRSISLRLASGDLSALDRLPQLPEQVCVSVPEGFAFYALYPEDYAKAARRFVAEVQPSRAVVIGIRSIGTSLSAVVAATLLQAGAQVSSFTVRPRGHPFDRRVEWHGFTFPPDAWFLIVDEGPGLSGSSLAAVARRLSESRVPDARIVLFPGWNADGSTFCSPAAAQQWVRHARYVEQREHFPGCRDLSAGRWREFLSVSQPVKPQHERRKYLRGSSLLKFEGLGDFGRAKFERAHILADAGFTNPPFGLEDGYLVSQFVSGKPVTSPEPDLADWISRYLHFLESHFACDRPVPFHENLEMMRTNVQEGLGAEWAARLDRLEQFQTTVCDRHTVQIDGRMLPHEFLHTGGGYLKTDALDHHDDHFFPGCQDIAWDFAAVEVEFGWSDFANKQPQSHRSFYHLAYLSYRLGYCSMAAQSSDDAAHFRTLVSQYAARIRNEIDCLR